MSNWLDQITGLRLPELAPGDHKPGSGKLCFMELAAFMDRQKHTAHPQGVCTAVNVLGISINDGIGDAHRSRLLPYVGMVLNSEDPSTSSFASMQDMGMEVAQEMTVKVVVNPFNGLNEHDMPFIRRERFIVGFAQSWARRFPLGPDLFSRHRYDDARLKQLLNYEQKVNMFANHGVMDKFDPLSDSCSYIGMMLSLVSLEPGNPCEAPLVNEAIQLLESVITMGPHTPLDQGIPNFKPEQVRERAIEWAEMAVS